MMYARSLNNGHIHRHGDDVGTRWPREERAPLLVIIKASVLDATLLASLVSLPFASILHFLDFLVAKSNIFYS